MIGFPHQKAANYLLPSAISDSTKKWDNVETAKLQSKDVSNVTIISNH